MIRTDRLADAMTAKSLSQGALARQVGVTASAIQQLVNGVTKRSRVIAEIAAVLDVSEEWLRGDSEIRDRYKNESMGLKETLEALNYDPSVPLYHDKISKISNISHTQSELFSYAYGALLVGKLPYDDTEGLTVEFGEAYSMEPTIYSGDVLLVHSHRLSLSVQDQIWRFEYGGLTMVRRLTRLPRGRLLIRADNPAVSDIEVDEDDVVLRGKIVAVWHMLY